MAGMAGSMASGHSWGMAVACRQASFCSMAVTGVVGSPALDNQDEALPVGYAFMSQAVAVQASATELMFIYRVHTFDTVYSPGTHEYFDTFEFP